MAKAKTKVSQSEAIRQALDALGSAVGAKDGLVWVKEHFPGLVGAKQEDSFASNWSTQKKKKFAPAAAVVPGPAVDRSVGRAAVAMAASLAGTKGNSFVERATEALKAELSPYVKIMGKDFVSQVLKTLPAK
jgi:hypothetical protein